MPQNKTCLIKVRVNPAMLRSAERAAKTNDVSVAALVRTGIRLVVKKLSR